MALAEHFSPAKRGRNGVSPATHGSALRRHTNPVRGRFVRQQFTCTSGNPDTWDWFACRRTACTWRRPSIRLRAGGRGDPRAACARDSPFLRKGDPDWIGIAAVSRHGRVDASAQKFRRPSRPGGRRCVRICRAVHRRGDGLGGDGSEADRSDAAVASASVAGRFARALETRSSSAHRPATTLVSRCDL